MLFRSASSWVCLMMSGASMGVGAAWGISWLRSQQPCSSPTVTLTSSAARSPSSGLLIGRDPPLLLKGQRHRQKRRIELITLLDVPESRSRPKQRGAETGDHIVVEERPVNESQAVILAYIMVDARLLEQR